MKTQLYIKRPMSFYGFPKMIDVIPTCRWRVDNGSELFIEVEWEEKEVIEDIVNILQKKEFVSEEFLRIEVTGDIQVCEVRG